MAHKREEIKRKYLMKVRIQEATSNVEQRVIAVKLQLLKDSHSISGLHYLHSL